MQIAKRGIANALQSFPNYTFPVNNPYMARAIQLAVENARFARGGPFGAVIVHDNKIIAEGSNRVTSANDPTAHAEIVAIREACSTLHRFELRGYELYASCEPCPMCLSAIYWARLDRVYFAGTAADASRAGFDDSFIYREVSKPPSSRTIPVLQIMHAESLAAFRAWAQQPNKVPY
jgi:guanine deaminase